jgi:cytochrome oxidase Cu insertion factor (SCO1/SenC/PrrC family)
MAFPKTRDKMKIIQIFVTVLLFVSNPLLTLCQTSKKVTVMIAATESSNGLDTAVISYKPNLEFAPAREVRKPFSNRMPATLEIDMQGLVGTLRVTVLGESTITVPTTYVEQGDTVWVLVKRKGKEVKASYSGKGFENYLIQSKLDSISFWGIYPANHNRQEKTKPVNLKSAFYRFDEVRKEKMELIHSYKQLLTPVLYSLYSADIYGRFISNSSATGVSFLEETEYEASLFPIIGQFLSMPLDTSDFTTQSLSREYLKGLRDYTKLKLVYSKHRQPQMKEIYEALKSNFIGRWKEKMVSYYLQSLPKANPSEYLDCLKDALSFVTDISNRNALQQLLNSRENGKPAYDFSLEDKDGKLVRLSDLKGKVVLLDFWFTGCTFCARLSKKMEQEILPSIKARDNFAYVSISVDKDRAKWMKSLASGEYTHGTNLNLTTGRSGSGHPIIAHYKIMNYPTLILIDRNGNIVDANMNYTENKEIIDRINNTF